MSAKNQNPRVSLHSLAADTGGSVQYETRPVLGKNANHFRYLCLLLPTFAYFLKNSNDRDIPIFNDLAPGRVIALECRPCSARLESASRTGNETGVPRCLTSTLYSSTGCEFYFLPEVSECLKSSHFPEPQASFSLKTGGSGPNKSPKIQGVSFLRAR